MIKILTLAYECVNAIGNSLDLDTMLYEFNTVFVRRSGAVCGYYTDRHNRRTAHVGKKIDNLPPYEGDKDNYQSQPYGTNNTLLYIPMDKGAYFTYLFRVHTYNLETIGAMFWKFRTKLAIAIAACETVRRNKENEARKLHESEERFNILIQNANDAIIVMDEQGIVHIWNPFAQRIFGRSTEEMIGQSIDVIFPPAPMSALSRMLERSNSIVAGGVFECRGLRNDGTTFPIEMSLSHWQSGGILYYSVIIRDITERKMAEETLRRLSERVRLESQKRIEHERLMLQHNRLAAMGEMVSNIAHQWRQPINALGLIIHDLVDADQYGELDHAYLERSSQKAMSLIDYMSNTIEDFRNFFAPNREQIDFSPADAINKALALVQTAFSTYNIRIDDRYSHCQSKIVGFPNEYAQVVLNILNNAKDVLIERRIANPLITIMLEKSDHHLILRIEDNAGGIPEAILDKIFEPYFTTKHQSQGTGLGLYMSKMIIESHMHGELFAENTPTGAQFVIRCATVSHNSPTP